MTAFALGLWGICVLKDHKLTRNKAQRNTKMLVLSSSSESWSDLEDGRSLACASVHVFVLAVGHYRIIDAHSTGVASTVVLRFTNHLGIGTVGNADMSDPITNFHPSIAACGNRAYLAEEPVRCSRDEEAAEEVQVVEVLSTFRDRAADGTDKADDIDENTANVGGITTPVEAEGKIIRAGMLSGVEVTNLKVAFADNVVIADHDASDR